MADNEMARKRLNLIKHVSVRLFWFISGLVCMGGALLVITTVKNFFDYTITMAPLIFITGMIGGYVGLQRRIKALSFDDLTLLSESMIYMTLSPLVGGILALLLYLILLSGLINGYLFPEFVADSDMPNDLRALFAHHANGYAAYAKLFVWSFIAGYSERFVTNIITSLAKTDIDTEHE